MSEKSACALSGDLGDEGNAFWSAIDADQQPRIKYSGENSRPSNVRPEEPVSAWATSARSSLRR